VAFLGLTLSGCATKGDLRGVEDAIQELAAQQRELFQELTGMNMAVQDTLGRQSDALFETRGETNRRIQSLEQEILTIQQLLELNQQSLMTIRDLLESQRSGGGQLMRTDTEPGQMSDVEMATGGEIAGGPRQTFDVAVESFNRGSLSTARRAFQDFLRSYSDNALAPEAHYYLAMILVREDRLQDAIPAFLELTQDYPTSEKVPDALYQVGVAYIALDDLDNAREYLQRVVNTYGDTDVAVQARERLAEIG